MSAWDSIRWLSENMSVELTEGIHDMWFLGHGLGLWLGTRRFDVRPIHYIHLLEKEQSTECQKQPQFTSGICPLCRTLPVSYHPVPLFRFLPHPLPDPCLKNCLCQNILCSFAFSCGLLVLTVFLEDSHVSSNPIPVFSLLPPVLVHSSYDCHFPKSEAGKALRKCLSKLGKVVHSHLQFKEFGRVPGRKWKPLIDSPLHPGDGPRLGNTYWTFFIWYLMPRSFQV